MTAKIEMQKKWHPSIHIQHKVIYMSKVTHLYLYSPLWSKRKALSMMQSEQMVDISNITYRGFTERMMISNIYIYLYVYVENKHSYTLSLALVSSDYEAEVNV